VITGGGEGLGRALARHFAGRGETVILLGRTFSKVRAVAEELGGSALALECDVSSADSVRAAFARIAERRPTIDVLINNAGIYEPFMVAEASDLQIDRIIATNLNGPVYCCRAAIPMMEAGAQIINVTSESVALPFVMLSLYQSTKAGLERLTEALALELKPQGIRVTAVRAGQMYDMDRPGPDWSPEVYGRFVQGCHANGLDLMTRPISLYSSVTGVFQALLDLPADVELPHVSIAARQS
jgi:3-oxoacyl-[acyl-carrier protein] reductase